MRAVGSRKSYSLRRLSTAFRDKRVKRLDEFSRMVWLTLAVATNDNGYLLLSSEQLGQVLGVSTSRISSALTTLASAGLIDKTRDGRSYRVYWNDEMRDIDDRRRRWREDKRRLARKAN